MRPALLALLATAPLFAQTTVAPTNGKGVNFYSVEREIAVGRTLASDIRSRTTPIPSQPVRDYVTLIGERLAAQLPDALFPFTFEVLAPGTPALEPMAVPGGTVFVPAELILDAQNESELAAHLAHAMIHISERHYTRQDTRGQIAGQAMIPLVVSAGGWAAYGVRNAAQTFIPVSLLRFARQYELDADAFGSALLARAGYDPTALARVAGRIPDLATPAAQATSTMPPVADRLARLATAIAALPARNYATPDAAIFTRVQAEVRAVTK
jgi:beta-barrel assembly-enhancing protease